MEEETESIVVGYDSFIHRHLKKIIGSLLVISLLAPPALIFHAIKKNYYEDPNPLKWSKKLGKEKEEQRQKRINMYNQAYECADNDGVKGLSIGEIADLYKRAGFSGNVRLEKRCQRDHCRDIIKLPHLSTENLEKAIKNYGCD